uniref:Uncharacterized protein n=1 Tax=Glossina palpalis gambiensis TaxID=67801 RepID=A0A1B0BZM4_9MUSC
MLLEHNDYHHYLRYRITSSHNLHHNEYHRDHLKGITMNKPSASLSMDKLIDCRLPQTELSHKEIKTLTSAPTTDMNFVFSSHSAPCNQAGKVPSAITPSSSASLSAVLSDFVSSLNHVNSSSSSSDAGNIASLDHQHNETTHANQIRNNNIPSNELNRIQTSTSLSATTTSNNLVDTKSAFSASNTKMTDLAPAASEDAVHLNLNRLKETLMHAEKKLYDKIMRILQIKFEHKCDKFP